MKNILFALIWTVFAATLTAQTTQPFYLMYSPGCMDQLEYRYTYQNAAVPAYSVRPNANEHYILTAATPGITSPTLPKNTVYCQDLPMQEGFLQMVNSRNRVVYVVHQTPQGYTMIPLVSATKVTRQGSLYIYEAPGYAFAFDTVQVELAKNLSLPNSNAYIFLTGFKRRGCAMEYTFRKETSTSGQQRSDFDFIPSIGITNDRTGTSASQAEANHLRLITVNTRALDDLLNGNCDQIKTSPASSISKWTQPVQYSTGNQPVIREGDKEATSIQQNSAQNPVTYSTPTNNPADFSACPEGPGEGYHIILPGENLFAIARTYNIPVKDLMTWNKIKDADKIKACQKLWLQKPPANAATTTQNKKEVPPATYNASNAKGVVDQRQYWAKSTEAPAPLTYSTPTQILNTSSNSTIPSVHVVRQGESLYRIAQQYNLPEDRLRVYNNFPLEGIVTIHPGDRLVLCDCNNTSTGASFKGQTTAPVTYSTPPTTFPQASTTSANVGNSIGAPPPGGNNMVSTPSEQPYYPPTNSNTATPTTTATSGVPSMRFDENQPVVSGNPNTTTSPVTYSTPTTYPQASSTQANTSQVLTKPTYTPYYVKQGDTISSVAIQFRVSPDELALINGKDINETLIAGQRLLIPKY